MPSTIFFTNFLTRFARLRDFFNAITPRPETTAVGSDNDGRILQREIKIFNKTRCLASTLEKFSVTADIMRTFIAKLFSSLSQSKNPRAE